MCLCVCVCLPSLVLLLNYLTEVFQKDFTSGPVLHILMLKLPSLLSKQADLLLLLLRRRLVLLLLLLRRSCLLPFSSSSASAGKIYCIHIVKFEKISQNLNVTLDGREKRHASAPTCTYRVDRG